MFRGLGQRSSRCMTNPLTSAQPDIMQKQVMQNKNPTSTMTMDTKDIFGEGSERVPGGGEDGVGRRHEEERPAHARGVKQRESRCYNECTTEHL